MRIFDIQLYRDGGSVKFQVVDTSFCECNSSSLGNHSPAFGFIISGLTFYKEFVG